jgi:hypothetical protein
MGEGTSPDRTISSRLTSGWEGSAAENSALVYGCKGFSKRSAVEEYSTN